MDCLLAVRLLLIDILLVVSVLLNGAARYMDWLLTVRLLPIEILLVVRVPINDA